MPVPSDITALSTTAASNSPAGSESPATADDYFRAHAAFIAQMRAVIGGATDANIPNASATIAQVISQSQNSGTTAGTSTAYTLTPGTALTSYSAGKTFWVTFHAASGASPTLQISGVATPPALVKQNAAGAYVAIAATDIPAGHSSRVTLLSATQALVEEMPPPTGLQPGEVAFFACNTAPAGYLKANGAAISRATYAALFAALIRSAVATMTVATPGVITWTAHGLFANDPVRFATTGALPTGIVAGTVYYVVGGSITTNTFQLSATAGGAAIATSGSQSGVHTAIHAPHGIGDGSTTFNVPDLRGEFVRGWDDSRGVDSARSFGSAQADDFKSHVHLTGTAIMLNSTPGTGGNAWSPGSQGQVSTTLATGGTETRPRNIALLACIKY